MNKKWFLVKKRHIVSIEHCTITDELLDISCGGSRSREYNTKEDLIESEGILSSPCKICGQIVDTAFCEPIRTTIKESNICFNCQHWLRIEETLSDDRRYIINNASYFVRDDINANDGFRGFGGAEFKIKRFGSDEIVVTHNLWCQGEIPEHWRKRLPNNAEFINK
jgi:hypothetical protein